MASMRREPITMGGRANGRAPAAASHGARPTPRAACHAISTAAATFIASTGSFSATSVGPSSHINGAAAYASRASR